MRGSRASAATAGSASSRSRRLPFAARSSCGRISLGIGAGDLPERALGAATGPAFEISGRGLDDMRHAQRFLIAWQRPPAEAPLLRAIFALADEISRKW